MTLPTEPLAIEPLLRRLAPQVLGVVARRIRDFTAAEDAVQEALLAAARQWPHEGLPRDPRAWLVHVASRRFADLLRREAARARRESIVVSLVPPEDQLAAALDRGIAPEHDDTLVLLFLCCHPALTTASAIALTLRAVGGLTTAEIARAFLVPEATMAQRISRAKQAIKGSGAPFSLPTPDERPARLRAVLHVLYLGFNEGYMASAGAALHRRDLSNEAIRLTRLLQERLPDDGEVTGLLALMLLTDARRAARAGPAGELVPLDAQDRSRWDRAAIAEGVALVDHAFSRGPPGPYALQAAIAALHDEAPSLETTDWPQILALYEVLERMAGGPMVTLSRAIAIAMVHGPSAGLELLATLDDDPTVAQHHRLHATRAHLFERANDPEAAIAGYQRAAELTASVPERDYLRMRAARLRSQLERPSRVPG
ncbi:RNA polymerase sigma factor [Paraliomyxa miuraensis]|uniref:RNA polymerase sigma factor n=1 Tax=Paraliomyxa miuraensis TaxID=376150 RepID=UPI002251FA64|nr:sigma-70 family RNA polymerase sigma factor [Paraliomyxa miuraensis]MCX4242293.1 sigma-70 family RNA polymerase sigma factor [Paraliomyxa miuraensis]